MRRALIAIVCLLVGVALLLALTLIVFGAINGASVAVVNPVTMLVLPTLAGLLLVLLGLRIFFRARARAG